MTTSVRVGVMGLGQRGLQHVKALWQLQQEGLAQIKALADPFDANLSPEKLRRFVPGLPADEIWRSSDPDAVIASGEVDALYVAIPPNVHRGEVVRAAEAGLHLFVEKPMSLFLDEALAMERAIADAGVLSTVGFQQRFASDHQAIHDLLADKNVVMASYTRHAPIEAHDVKHMPTETAAGPSNRVWTASMAWSGGTMVEAGIHPLDLWRYWFGDVVWVQAVYNHRLADEVIDGADNPHTYAATFGFANEATGVMTLSRLRRVYFDETDHKVLWNRGIVALEEEGPFVYRYHGEYPPVRRPGVEQVRTALPVPELPNSTLGISRAFVQAIAQNRLELIRSPFSDAMNSLAAVIAANVSDALGGERVYLNDLLNDEKYAVYRQRPA